ncbi:MULTISPECIES: HAD family hydrolase [unclassified Thioalkalivibrio]|uniref:HAD family hydrolase n=1 Tax=unclassified Thioalkalivibrio TaxID=2621013 RepID=UPI000362E7E1|nr:MULTISPECIES: HAD-IA family hydrolase [unclassified Thioalkalivibrio]
MNHSIASGPRGPAPLDPDRIRCLTFDLDDTLWPVMPVIHHAEARFYAWLREHAPAVCERFDPDDLIQERTAFMRAAPDHERHDLTRLRKRWLRELADSCGCCPDHLSSEGFQVFWEARNEVTPYPEAESVLTTLSRHFRLGAISNGNADVFRTPLGQYFDFAIAAGEAGAAKPDPHIFDQARKHAGMAPDAILHVGDDSTADVLGALQAGFRAAWFNPQSLPWEHGHPRPCLTLGRLGQLPRHLGIDT